MVTMVLDSMEVVPLLGRITGVFGGFDNLRLQIELGDRIYNRADGCVETSSAGTTYQCQDTIRELLERFGVRNVEGLQGELVVLHLNGRFGTPYDVQPHQSYHP